MRIRTPSSNMGTEKLKLKRRIANKRNANFRTVVWIDAEAPVNFLRSNNALEAPIIMDMFMTKIMNSMIAAVSPLNNKNPFCEINDPISQS